MPDPAVLPANFTISDAAKLEIENLRQFYDARSSDPAAVVMIGWGLLASNTGRRWENVIVGFYGHSELDQVAHGVQEVSELQVVFFTTAEHHPKFEGKSSTMTKREGFSCAIKPGGPTAPEFARPPARPCEFQHGRAPDRASSPSCRVGGRFTAIERSSRPRRREEEAARRLVGTAALPVLAVARHGGVRVRDHLAVLEHVAARRHLDLFLGDRRAVEGVAAPFARRIDTALLVDPDVVRGRGRREDERHQGGAKETPPNSASRHERSPGMYGSERQRRGASKRFTTGRLIRRARGTRSDGRASGGIQPACRRYALYLRKG